DAHEAGTRCAWQQQRVRTQNQSVTRINPQPPVPETFGQLPSSSRSPEDQRAKNRQHEHKSEDLRIERKIEEVKRQAARKNLIFPGVRGHRKSARPEK